MPVRRVDNLELPSLLSCLALGSGAAPAGPQVGEVGHPLVRTIAPAEYDGGLQIFSGAQGPDGILHFACPEDFALLSYDGERWRKTVLGVPPVSVDVDADGRLWVGSSDDFGFLQPAAGGMQFVSVAGAVVEQEPARLSFIKTACTPRGVFFLSKEALVLWDGERERSWRAPEATGFMDVEALGEDVFVLEGGSGLSVLADGELLESDALGPERVLFDALWSDGEELLGVWLNGEGLHRIRSGEESPTTLAVPELVRGPTYLSDVVVTRDGTLVVSSASGILLVDAGGRFQAWLDDQAGLPNSLAYSLFLDREGAVWANLSYGIARIDASATSSFFGRELGLVGTPLVFARHEDATYCGTFEGLFRLVHESRARFERVKPVPSQAVFDLASTPHGLLIATELGLLLWDGTRRSQISSQQPLALSLLEQPGEEDAVVVASFDVLEIFRWKEGAGWSSDESMPVPWGTDQIETWAGGMWVHSDDHEIFRVPYDGALGDPVQVPEQWLGMTAVPGGLLAWNCERMVLLSDASPVPQPFAPAASLDWAALQRQSRWVRPRVDQAGRMWLLDPHSLRRLQGDLAVGVRPEADLVWTSPMPLEGAQFDERDDRVVWLGTHEGVVRLATEGLRAPAACDPLIWPSTRAGDAPWGPLPDGRLPVGSSFWVDVAAASFDATPTTYRYRLEGLENDWGAWTREPHKEYTHLPGGDYTLAVQSMKQGRILGESRLAFGVRAPWHATWPALVAGLVLLGAAVFGGVRWRSARLARENERLGRVVAERMRDLEGVKARVLEHAEELERVNDLLVSEMEAREAADLAQREMHERLEKAERLESLGVMAAGIAHDFNNYLTSILGYAQMALDDRIGRAERAEHLRNVTQISRQAAELCSGLLSLAGRTPLVTEPIELSSAVRGMEALLRASVKDRGKLRLELAEALPPIAGDSSHLRRALLNLVLNAAEASERARSPIVVRTGAAVLDPSDLARLHKGGQREPGTYVYVEVEDAGTGMTPESLHHIFDPFFSTKHVGRGLGLTTVFRIVSSHGGVIDVRSTAGRGTRVRLLFPRGVLLPAAPAEAAHARARAPLSGRVLVVDDDENVRRLSTLFCRRLGLEVASAGGGPEALAWLASARERVDAVLLDLSMPGMDGHQVLAEIRRSHPDLPVLLVSGYVERLPSEPDGATRFLAKPFSLETLATTLQQALERAPARLRAPGPAAAHEPAREAAAG
jgi:signal transduction histidine kinase/ActR/RegA family two-component response regulator